MSFVLWFRDRNVGFGSGRVVMRAAEVPMCKSAEALRDRLEQLNEGEADRIAAAAEEARVKGFVAGREEGVLQARDEMAEAILELTQSAARQRERVRGEVAALALEVVRKMIGGLPADAVLVGLAETAASDMLPTQTMTLVVQSFTRSSATRCALVSQRLRRPPPAKDLKCVSKCAAMPPARSIRA
jgi:hypothetical protein